MVTGIDGRPILGYARDRPCLSRLAHSLRKVELADQIAEDDRAVAGRPLTHYWRPAEQCRASQMKIGWHAA